MASYRNLSKAEMLQQEEQINFLVSQEQKIVTASI